MRRVFIWLISVVAFLAIATVFDQVQWGDLFDRMRQGSGPARDVSGPSSETVQAADTGSHSRSVEVSASGSGKDYFPEDTPQLLYEYSVGGPLFTGILSGFEKRLTMIERVDGFRTINGKRYYKEVSEFTGQEDLLEFLKNPPADVKDDQFFKSGQAGQLSSVLDGIFMTHITYARWDASGELEVDGDDLTQPETRTTPLHADVGSEWTEQGLHLKAVSIEDVEIGNQTYKDCLKVRGSGNAGGTSVQGVVSYNAAGIGAIKMTLPNDVIFVLRKYRR